MYKLFAKFVKRFDKSPKKSGNNVVITEKELEKKVMEGAHKAAKDYKETFRILADYDKA